MLQTSRVVIVRFAQVLTLEGKLRDATTSLKKTQDALTLETQTRYKFDVRYAQHAACVSSRWESAGIASTG